MDYKTVLEKSPDASLIISEEEWDRMDLVNEKTADYLTEIHIANMKENIKNGLWKKHGPISHGIYKLGEGKAVIGIGAGPSYALNSDVLKQVHDLNVLSPLDKQPFVTICSNHQFRPCLKAGIAPHFVCVVDSGEVHDQHLINDIPSYGENTILLTGLHTSPKVLKQWDEKGRAILFYVQCLDRKQETFKELTNEDPEPYLCEEGGNVMNMMWILSIKFLHSKVFMAVGNDLSYPVASDLHKRRASFYADGDYAVNIKNRRDEARNTLTWMGFEIEWNDIIQKHVVNLKPMYTSWQLWVYKKWIELQALFTVNSVESFHYYNCSERGILGVLLKDHNGDKLDKKSWTMMDELLPKKWHTRRFIDAVNQYLKARNVWEGKVETPIFAGAGAWPGRIHTVRPVDLRPVYQATYH